ARTELPGTVAGLDHAARQFADHGTVCAARTALSRAAPHVPAVALSRLGAGASAADARTACRLRLSSDGAFGHRRGVRTFLEVQLEQAQAGRRHGQQAPAHRSANGIGLGVPRTVAEVRLAGFVSATYGLGN